MAKNTFVAEVTFLLVSKRMHLIKKVWLLKGDSNSKHFSFFVFYFNVSNKISSTPPRPLNFQEFSNPLPPMFIKFWRIYQPSPLAAVYSKPRFYQELKNRLLCKTIANITGKLLQNYK